MWLPKPTKISISTWECKQNVAVAYLWREFKCCGTLSLWDVDFICLQDFAAYLAFCGIVLHNAQLYETSLLENRRNQVRPRDTEIQEGLHTSSVQGYRNQEGLQVISTSSSWLWCGSYSLAAFNPCDWMLRGSDKALLGCTGSRLGEKWPA